MTNSSDDESAAAEPRDGTPSPSEGSAEEPPLNPKSWAFWKKRISRALIVGALALTASQILPALPEEQVVVIVAPEGTTLTRAQLTYFSKDDGEALGGTELVPAGAASRLTHAVNLPNGDYTVSLNAIGETSAGDLQTFSSNRTIQLSGQTTKIQLKASARPR